MRIAGYQVRDLIVSEFPSVAEVEAAHERKT